MTEPSTKGFYLASLEHVPGIKNLLANGELISEIKSASDWSYSASCYGFPGVRIAGDAGSFIDPFFSSGVHLALSGGLSAATTISAVYRGDCDEETASSWHDKKTTESYTRFLLVVSSALKQIRSQDVPVIDDFNEQGFERAFDLFRPSKPTHTFHLACASLHYMVLSDTETLQSFRAPSTPMRTAN